jgi:cysteinyl-tRNA synthetase
VLGLFWKAPAGEAWTPEILALVDQREEARRARDWKRADALRADLGRLGVLVEDGPAGPKLKRS